MLRGLKDIICQTLNCTLPTMSPSVIFTVSPSVTSTPSIPAISPTEAPTDDPNGLNWLWALPAVLVPALIVAIVTKPNILRDWGRILTCQHRSPTPDEE